MHSNVRTSQTTMHEMPLSQRTRTIFPPKPRSSFCKSKAPTETVGKLWTPARIVKIYFGKLSPLGLVHLKGLMWLQGQTYRLGAHKKRTTSCHPIHSSKYKAKVLRLMHLGRYLHSRFRATNRNQYRRPKWSSRNLKNIHLVLNIRLH